ncbi:hypothetical protein ABIC08_008297 [Bradyrhizobium sp. RT9b]
MRLTLAKLPLAQRDPHLTKIAIAERSLENTT